MATPIGKLNWPSPLPREPHFSRNTCASALEALIRAARRRIVNSSSIVLTLRTLSRGGDLRSARLSRLAVVISCPLLSHLSRWDKPPAGVEREGDQQVARCRRCSSRRSHAGRDALPVWPTAAGSTPGQMLA